MRDLQVEDWLKEHRYKFQFVVDHPIDDIDIDEAKKNPVRLDAGFNEDVSTAYGCKMIDHGTTSRFPAVVLLEVAARKLKRVLGGTHRLVGAIEGKFTTFDAYVIRETDPARVDFVHAMLNSLEGVGETINGRLKWIAELREKHPTATKLTELAKEYGIPRQTVSEYIQAAKVEHRADRLGVGTFFSSSKLPVRTKAAFDGLQSDATFIAAAQLIQAHADLRGGAGVSFIKELKTAGSEVKAKALIMDRDRELTKAEEQRKGKKVKTSKSKATRFLSRVHGVVKGWPGTVERLYLAGLETVAAMRRELTAIEQSIDIHMECREELKRLIGEAEKASEWDGKEHGDSPSDPISPPA